MKFRKMIIVLGIVGASATVTAADFQDGFEAAAKSDYKKAAAIWQALAEKGDADAQFNLGAMYHSGAAGYMNEKEALKWYHKAANNGHFRAQEYLVVGYREGWYGLDKDESKAKFWEQKLEQ